MNTERLRRIKDSPGGLLVHPAFLLALGLLALNDHIVKQQWPGAVSGKLSDFAGLFFFPVLVISLIEIALAMGGKRWKVPTWTCWSVAGLTAVSFLAIKVSPSAADFFERTSDIVTANATVTPDASDLIALPMTAAAAAFVSSQRRSLGSE